METATENSEMSDIIGEEQHQYIMHAWGYITYHDSPMTADSVAGHSGMLGIVFQHVSGGPLAPVSTMQFPQELH